AQGPPHVTIIRPLKGLEPALYDCLASTFRQDYPRERTTIRLCVAQRSDPAVPIAQKVLDDFRGFNARLLVEEEDPSLLGRDEGKRELGPNPKIRNMSRAYREAKGDIVWIIDCNVWVAKGVMGRMVDTLCGFGDNRKFAYKFVHQLPLVVDMDRDEEGIGAEMRRLLRSNDSSEDQSDGQQDDGATVPPKEPAAKPSLFRRVARTGGGRLEELFMASAHAKFYTAINTVLIAPCIVGKSSMFRRSHLDALTRQAAGSQTKPEAQAKRPADQQTPLSGLDFFSHNICEDHLIGDLLWKRRVPNEPRPSLLRPPWQPPSGPSPPLGKHALCFGDLAIQPMAAFPVGAYVARRARWLRVRKYTVPAATGVEPGTESLLCSALGGAAFARLALPWLRGLCARDAAPPCCSYASRLPPWLRPDPGPLLAALAFFAASLALWAVADWVLYARLHAGRSVAQDTDTPVFARRLRGGQRRRPLGEWAAAWVGREVLAWPVWVWAVLGGATVEWRGRRYKVGMDMRTREVRT
ncbi:hypothetical protein BDY21DRAFT_395823, partial [Lineolata rhizophorae]